MRILQGKDSLPLSNNSRPGVYTKILSWAQLRRWSLKTTTTHPELLVVPFIFAKSLSFPEAVQRARNVNTPRKINVPGMLAF